MLIQNEKIYVKPKQVALIKSFEEKDDRTGEVTYWIGYLMSGGAYYVQKFSDEETRNRAILHWRTCYDLWQINEDN